MTARPARRRPAPTVIGWREWVALPEWGVEHLKAKIDTGARTSALHAYDLETIDLDGRPGVRFAIHPWQESARDTVVVEAPLVDQREVRSSSGVSRSRPVTMTTVRLAGQDVPIEITLTRRDEMGFRMLIGRQALRTSFLVDPRRSYLGGRPDKQVRRRNRGAA